MSGTVTNDNHRLLAGVDWTKLNPGGVPAHIRRLIITAALVELRGDDYGQYLRRIFHDDEEFLQKISRWSDEETSHGATLFEWLKRTDPQFDIESAYANFAQAAELSYKSNRSSVSIRGSKEQELISRCVVESGTSTYYTAIANMVNDPTLERLCRNIAKDEINHYVMFKKKLQRMHRDNPIRAMNLLFTGIKRFLESNDTHLSSAYQFAGNAPSASDQKHYSICLNRDLYSVYSRNEVYRLVVLFLDSVFLNRKTAKYIRKLGVYRLTSEVFFTGIQIYRWWLDFRIDIRRFQYWMRLKSR